MSSRAFTPAFSSALVLVVGLSARAGVRYGGRTALTEDDKPVSIFAGVAVGTDSNVGRASTDEESDIIIQLLAGVAFTGGSERSRGDLRVQYRHDSHAELSDLDFDEFQGTLAAFTGTDKFRFRIVGAYEELVDPTDVEIIELLERTRISYAPAVEFEFGALGLALGYSAEKLDYAEPRCDRLDFEEEVWSGELRWVRKQTQRIFARFEAGDLDYLSTQDHSFERQRVCLGFRAESRRNSGLEVALGVDAVEKYGVTGELYALVRGTKVLGGGRSIFEVLAAHGTEAAADADFKRATRVLVRYTHEASRRLAWTISLSGENGDIYHPTTTSDPLLLVSVDAGVNLEIGSPGGKAHGRCFLTLAHELRTAPISADEYSRFRFLIGAAVVH